MATFLLEVPLPALAGASSDIVTTSNRPAPFPYFLQVARDHGEARHKSERSATDKFRTSYSSLTLAFALQAAVAAPTGGTSRFLGTVPAKKRLTFIKHYFLPCYPQRST